MNFKKLFGQFLKTVLPLGLGIYLVYFFFANMSKEHMDYFKKALREANYFWVVLSLSLAFLALCIRAYRWKYALEPLGHKTKFWHRYHAMMIGYVLNFTIPRSGEPARAAMLYRSSGVPFSQGFGTIVAERVIDFIMLLLVAGITFVVSAGDLSEILGQISTEFAGKKAVNGEMSWGKIIFYSVIILGFFGFIYVLTNTKLRNKLIEFAKGIWQGLVGVFKSKHPVAYLSQTVAIWGLYLTYYGIVYFALVETTDVPFKGILVGFIAGSLGITFTNGGIGTFPLLVGMTVGFYLSDKYGTNAIAIGNALGMIIWVSQTLLMIVLGLLSLILIPKNFTKENDERIPENPA